MILKSFAWVEAISNLCFTNLSVCTLISHRHDKLHEYTYSSQWEKREDIKREYKGQKDGSFFSSAFEEAVPKLCEYIRGSLCATLSAFKTRVWGDPTIVSFSVCCLQRGRERERKRERERAAAFPPTRVICSSLIQRCPLNLWKHFLSTAAFQLSRAHLATSTLLSYPQPRCCWLTAWFAFQRNLTGSEEVAECLLSGGAFRVIMAMSQERSACLGLWVLLLLGACIKEAVEGCSCHPAHPQQLFCGAEIGKLITGDQFCLVYSLR